MVSSILSSRSREKVAWPSDREDIDYRGRGQLGLLILPVRHASDGMGQCRDSRAQENDDVEGLAEPHRLRNKPYRGRPGQETEVPDGRDGGYRRSGGYSAGASRRTERDGEDDREPRAGAGKAGQGEERLRDG